MHFDDITYQTDYWDIEATVVICNLLKNNPESITTMDVNMLFRWIGIILSEKQKTYLIERMESLSWFESNTIANEIFEVMNKCYYQTLGPIRLCAEKYFDISPLIRDLMQATLPPDRSLLQMSDTESRLADLCLNLNISSDEAKLVKLVLLQNEKHWLLEEVFPLSVDRNRHCLKKDIASLLDISETDAAKLLSEDSAPFSTGIINPPSPPKFFKIQSGVREYLNGTSASSTLADAIFEKLATSTEPRKPVNVPEQKWTLLTSILGTSGGTNILLYGAPGTGKTTTAVALAQATEFQPISIRSSADSCIDDRIANLKCAIKMAESSATRLLIVVDEADQLLGTRVAWNMYGLRIDDGWLNKIMDSCKVKIIWITNCINEIDVSTLRRFQYSLEFKDYTDRERRIAWKDILSNSPEIAATLNENSVAELACKYKLQPAQIADSVLQTSQQNLESSERLSMLEELLASHNERLHGSRYSRSAILALPSSHTSIDGLSTDHDLQEILGIMKLFSEKLQADDGRLQIGNMNLLLTGPPGTGKTEFAKLAAKSLDMELTLRSASQLKSSEVGGTEKNIANAFQEAERDQSILLIDEADSFLWPRESADKSNDVSMVNAFLAQMDNFRGILICTSNHIDRFGDAAIRRFKFKVRFDYLRPDGVLVMFRNVLGHLVSNKKVVELTKDQLERLYLMDLLTPGDFKVVLQQHEFLDDGTVDVDRLIDALETETRHRRGRSGRTVQLVKR